MMEPIIKACMTELNTQMEGDVLKVCHSYGIDVDKERLMQALTDARKFYDEGYRDGKRDAVRQGRWIAVKDFGGGQCIGYCSECRAIHRASNPSALKLEYRHCRFCGAKMEEVEA